MRVFCFIALGLIIIALSAASCGDKLAAAPVARVSLPDWPQWRGLAHDGISRETDFEPLALKGLDEPLSKGHPRLVWKAKIDWGYAGVAVAGEHAYTMGFTRQLKGLTGADTVYCLDADTGKTVWTFSYPGTASTYSGPRAIPLVRDWRVYTLSWDGKLFCLDALSGKSLWSADLKETYGLKPRDMEFGFCAPPVIQGDVLLVNARTWGVALNRLTGKEIWASPDAVSGYAPPVPFTRGGRNLAAVFGAKKLFIVETATGAVVADADWPTIYQGNFADPIVLGDDILVTSTYGQGYGLFRFNGSTLSPVYRVPGLGAQMAAGVVIDGYYYGHDYWYFYGRGEYRCLETATGKTMWTVKQGMGSVIAIGKTLLFLSESGRLSAVEARPDKFSEIAACQLGPKRKGDWFTPPTFVRSRLFVRNYRGDVFCLDLGKKR